MTWKDEIKKEDMADMKGIDIRRIDANISRMKNLESLLNGLVKKGLYSKKGEEYEKMGSIDYAIKFLSSGIDLLKDIGETLPAYDDEESESDKHDAEVMRRLREGGDYNEARVNLGSKR